MKPLAFILSLAFASSAFAGTLTITPTTTLAIQTSNNTSASSTFFGTSNGNPAPRNISKLPIRELLYAGATTKIYVHVQPWFGKSNHINIGYNSTDSAQAARQVNDMISRGVDGLFVDWYGQGNSFINTASLALFHQAELHSGFKFGIVYDGGALKGASSPTSRVISDLTYAYRTYWNSASYMRRDGRPVVMFFSVDSFNIDWNKVRASVPGNPILVFRNSGGFTKTQSSGAFGWVGISSDPSNMGIGYLDNFHNTAVSKEPKLGVGSSYKGFNDTIAAWSAHRVVSQQCGQTWLSTFASIGKHYSASHQLEALQIPTWNDYEEGTEIETGIDTCVSISAKHSSGTLYWSISGGKENTIDHYNIYISKDGANLMKLAEQAVGTRSMNLTGYSLASGTYKLFVQAIGQPSMQNKMSNAASMTR